MVKIPKFRAHCFCFFFFFFFSRTVGLHSYHTETLPINISLLCNRLSLELENFFEKKKHTSENHLTSTRRVDESYNRAERFFNFTLLLYDDTSNTTTCSVREILCKLSDPSMVYAPAFFMNFGLWMSLVSSFAKDLACFLPSYDFPVSGSCHLLVPRHSERIYADLLRLQFQVAESSRTVPR